MQEIIDEVKADKKCLENDVAQLLNIGTETVAKFSLATFNLRDQFDIFSVFPQIL